MKELKFKVAYCLLFRIEDIIVRTIPIIYKKAPKISKAKEIDFINDPQRRSLNIYFKEGSYTVKIYLQGKIHFIFVGGQSL